MRLTALATGALIMAQPALSDSPQIVTDIAVTHGLVLAIAGDRAEVTLLLEAGGDPHSFQMRPSQARALSSADLLVWVGPELTPWLARALEANSGDGSRLELLRAEGVYLREIGDEASEDHDHDHGEEHAHDDHGHDDHAHDDHAHEDHAQKDHDHAHDDHGHDDHAHHQHEGTDPHAWLDPANAALWTTAIADALTALDPEGADDYRMRAKALAQNITEAEGAIRTKMDALPQATLVFQHDAYGYFTDHFGLNETAAIADVDGIDPGAGRMSELAASLTTGCVFGEVGQNTALPERLAQDLDAGFAILDPTGAGIPPGPDHYITLIETLADTISGCIAPRG